MQYILAAVLGITQGITEFLPISSTAHLTLIPWFGNFQDWGLSFDVALHGGTVIAVLGYFFVDWIKLIQRAFSRRVFGYEQISKNLFWFILIASIPGGLAGIFLESKAETTFRHPLIIAFVLIVFGLILFVADRSGRKQKEIGEISFIDSIWIGIAQALAIIPGVSRSGATITAGLFSGLGRQTAARFSFLLATPIMIGAFVYKLKDIIKLGQANGEWEVIIIGFIASMISGLFAIRFLLNFIKKQSYAVFVLYRILLAVAIILVFILRK